MDSLLKIANNNNNNNNPKATTTAAAATTTTTSGRIVAATADNDSLVPSLYNDNDLLVIDASIKPLVPGLLDNLDATPSGTTTTTTVTNNGLSKW